ncbi:MAG: hypothetical protein JNK78_19130 [Planctomycetes bacterium]|nr:hypothetical protein [Planctomycetota bacterium]
MTSLAGCSGGSGEVGSSTFRCVGGTANAICMQNCNLGCSDTGCARTDIAQNEILIFQFSQDIDPASVSPSSIRLRTVSGDQPVGEFLVNGNQVEFVPTLQVIGGQTFFGFTAGETYTMTIPGAGSPSVVRSTSGKPFAKTLSCTFRSSQGIVDLNGVPPRATMISPTVSQLGGAPQDIPIVLEFNELIDATPFGGGNSPVTFQVRRTIETSDPNDGDAVECDFASAPVALAGSTRLDFDAARLISVVTFTPTSPLPPNVCIEVAVTTAVADLSGRSAQPQQFSFLTVRLPQVEVPVPEEFDTTQFFDDESSAATWGGGQAVFAKIGGDARHGTFSPSLGTAQGLINGKQTFLFNTDNTLIPATNTITGAPLTVSNGRYFFDKMVVPSDVRLRFVGSWPPVFTVAGRLDIQGEIDVAGQSVPVVASPGANGQAGGAGGVFGGAGGKGGDRPLSSPGAAPNGADGVAARVLAGHAYTSSAAATGGRGSSVFPASGLATDLIYPPLPFIIAYSASAAAGGGGGGFVNAGGLGRVVSNNFPNGASAMGPDAAGGAAMQLFPFPVVPGLDRSSMHFLVGGAGGGGAGSHGCFSPSSNKVLVGGGGGGGGGGAIALRAGDSLRLAPTGLVLASGGGTPNSNATAFSAAPGPGGGGSGGSVVLQTGRVSDLLGIIDVRGGTGGNMARTSSANVGSVPVNPPNTQVTIKAGDGSPGFVRFEAPVAPTTSQLVAMLPAATVDNVGQLAERDDFASLRSKFYSTGLVFGPTYARYEIYATVDGVPMVFSDDPNVSTVAATVGAPIRALFQAGTIDLVTGAVIATGVWRTGVRTVLGVTGIQSDALNGFRFMLVMDGALATNVSVQKVVVVYRN